MTGDCFAAGVEQQRELTPEAKLDAVSARCPADMFSTGHP
jgi:hypothetical protein